MKPVKTTIEPPDRTTTWAWSGRSLPGYPTETYRRRNDTPRDHPNAEPSNERGTELLEEYSTRTSQYALRIQRRRLLLEREGPPLPKSPRPVCFVEGVHRSQRPAMATERSLRSTD